MTVATDKIKCLLQLTKNNYFTENAYVNFDIRRLSKEKVGFNRVIKIILPSVQNRDEFLKGANELKNAPEPCCKLFINTPYTSQGIIDFGKR